MRVTHIGENNPFYSLYPFKCQSHTQKNSLRDIPRSIFDEISGDPIVQSSRNIKLTIITDEEKQKH